MLKRIIIITVSLIGVLILFGGGSLYYFLQQQKKLSEGELYFGEEKSITIPFYYSTSGHILIDVKFDNSKKAYPFILDSGASNFIFKHHSNEFELESNGKMIGRGATGNFFLASVKKVDAIEIGQMRIENLNFKELGFNFNCTDEIYGLIGNGTMKNVDWQIDFENQQITITQSLNDLKFNENKIEIPLHVNKSSFHIRTSIQFSKEKKSKSVLVDLGNNGVLSLVEKSVLKDSLKLQTRKYLGKSSEGLGGESKSSDTEKLVLLDSLYFKKTPFNIQKVPALMSPTSANLLGLGFFKKYKTTLSWKSKKMILEPYDSIPNFIWKSNGLGTKFDEESNKLIVKSILENSSADEMKIPLNAEVLSYNNESMDSEKALCEYRNRKNTSDSLKVKIKHNNSVKEITIVKEPVFH
ncbi:aspartyl protease family protein [Tenacibaculum jejuense]|uniref:Putative PDZ/DHR/GLGF domain protein n=1 Tax=Tenacibaculum jejuense TaxID=584609 RepID=A0A238U629_9FLAO|nr:aspartyl protease family protein [Tenacibaculum jejuense]SNR14058.1 putative PDZ/DHR/GLGF domain protein [Tenacibaculum jejuense]